MEGEPPIEVHSESDKDALTSSTEDTADVWEEWDTTMSRRLGSFIDQATCLEQEIAEDYLGDVAYALEKSDVSIEPPRLWPATYRKLLFQKKKYDTRFTLFLFMVGNGVKPEIAALWTMAAGAKSYDITAYRHILGLVDDYNRGKFQKYKTYDMGKKKLI